MRAAWARWVTICTEREQASSQALVRIALGAVVLLDSLRALGSEATDVLRLAASDGGITPGRHLHWLVELLGGHEPGVVHALGVAAVVAAAALTIGIGGRWSALVLLQVMLAIKSLSTATSGSYDLVIANGLWLLVLSSSTATLSVDCRIRTGSWTSRRLVYAFPRYLMVAQIVLIYTATGLGKRGTGWYWPYDGLHYSLLRVGYPRFEMPWLGEVALLTRLGTAVTWYWETLFGVLGLWFVAWHGWIGDRAATWARRNDLRPVWLGVGVMLHVGIWATMDIGPFSGATLAFYLAFVEPYGSGQS